MCGFTGFFAKDAKYDRYHMQRIAGEMASALQHRGPDAGDVWQDPDVSLALAHRRLSIIDLSTHGAQPMLSHDERYVISYNGEVYNFPALRQDLEKEGVQFEGRSDTEIMLAAIQLWGLNRAVQKFNGMFAFALWDRRAKELHFVRDRFGKKPLYVGWAGTHLVFGSELKALCAHPDFKRELNVDALHLYFRHSGVPAPHSIYQNVWSVPAGSRLTLDLKDLPAGSDLSAQMRPYWSHSDAMFQARENMAVQAARPDAQVIDEFEELLQNCVQDRMISDVPLGAFLSGGIDSTAIVALMQKQSAQKIKTYTIGFEETGYNEAEDAKKIAEYLGTDHHELYVSSKDSLNVIPYLSQIYDEPFADMSAIPTFLVSKFARQSVSVALSGDGGDEMLGGYNRHVQAPRIWGAKKRIPGVLHGGLSKGISSISVKTWGKLLPFLPAPGTRMHKLADILKIGSQEQMYKSLISTWRNPSDILSQGSEAEFFADHFSARLSELSFAERMMFWDTLNYLPYDVLTKVDRATMAVSLEARAPLLDQRIFSFAWALPERMKIRDGKGKWLLQAMLKRHVSPSMFERPKQGFTMPVGDWLRGDLKDWAHTLLDQTKMEADGLLNAPEIQKIWQEHLAGKGNHAQRLWSVLMFQAWKEKWLP